MFRVYALEARSEFLKLARMRTYTISTLLFPLMFYGFFGLAMGRQAVEGFPVPMARYLLATYGAFGVIGAALYAFGVGVAVERGLGWLQVKRASPMPPAAYFTAKLAVSMAFGGAVVVLLFVTGALFGGVTMPLSQWLLMGAALILGSAPFCAMGLVIGCFAGPNSAPATVNMIYLPMSFCAGLWIPFAFLPPFLQRIGPLLPGYHLAQIALAILHAPSEGSVWSHVMALAAFTMIFTGLAWVGLSREREKMYG